MAFDVSGGMKSQGTFEFLLSEGGYKSELHHIGNKWLVAREHYAEDTS